MRLLHSKDLSFTSFMEYESIPKYAILSHTWGEDEVTYKDIVKRPKEAALKRGYRKIKDCALQALKDSIDYIWVDTCCIDKTSSSELSEAINSMFRWYRDAHVCYAYLSDTPERLPGTDHRTWISKFQASRWFTRGWTLQELIAPRSLQFYSGNWSQVGTKKDLSAAITARTGIPYEVVVSNDFSKASLAQRMSWAAGRSTSVREDAAYCLMGLFDVNMPMLYGEGDNAFLRLQEEITKKSDDMSIFAWVSSRATFSAYRGLLARSTSDFSQCNDIRWARWANNEPYQTTNKGINISLPLIAREGRPGEHIALLPGVYKKPNLEIGIFLQKVGEEQYARIETAQLAMPQMGPTGSSSSPVKFFVRQNIIMEAAGHARAAGISLRVDAPGMEQLDVHPANGWDEGAKFLSFTVPTVVTKPPAAVFTFQPVGAFGSGMKITVDAGKPWKYVLGVDKNWSVSPVVSDFRHKIHCRRPRQPVIEVIAERGVFDGEAKIMLSVVALRNADSPV